MRRLITLLTGGLLCASVAFGQWGHTPASDSLKLGGELPAWWQDLANGTGTISQGSQLLITELGTITTGVWNATAIDEAYLDSDIAEVDEYNIFAESNTFQKVIYTTTTGNNHMESTGTGITLYQIKNGLSTAKFGLNSSGSFVATLLGVTEDPVWSFETNGTLKLGDDLQFIINEDGTVKGSGNTWSNFVFGADIDLPSAQLSGDIGAARMTANAPVSSDFAANGDFLVGTGAGTFAAENGATARTSMGLGTGDSPTFLGLETTGPLKSEVPITLDLLASTNLSASACRGTIRINGDDDVITYVLPTAEVGLVVTFANALYARVITVDANSSDKIILNDGSVTAADGDVVSSGAIDDKGTFVAIDSEYWMLFSEQNAWAD